MRTRAMSLNVARNDTPGRELLVSLAYLGLSCCSSKNLRHLHPPRSLVFRIGDVTGMQKAYNPPRLMRKDS